MRPDLARNGFVRRWGAFLGATLATIVLAGCAAATGEFLTTPRAQPSPQLKAVSTATLAALGLRLDAATQPPYCGVAGNLPRPGWVPAPPAAAGCAVDRSTAEAAAASGGGVSQVESVLALVTSSRPALVGRNHLTWLVVTQRTSGRRVVYSGTCPSAAGGFTACPGGQSRPLLQLVLVDGHSGAVMTTLPLSPPVSGVGRFRGRVPTSGG